MAKKYIDADKLAIDLQHRCDALCPYTKAQRDVMCRACLLGDAIDTVEDQPAVDIPRWIPCSEKLPEEDYETGNGVQFSNDVLATIVNHANDGELYVWLLKTVDGKWYDYTPNEDGSHEVQYLCEVIAWMPLPKPYKEGEEE